jgi:predicted amidohydrolase YtcJ
MRLTSSKTNLISGIAVLLVVASFVGIVASQSAKSPLAPDLVLVDGKVLTMDDSGLIAQAVAVKGDRFVAVGTTEQIHLLAGPATRVVSLRGRTVLPGLVDAHSHTSGIPTDWLDLFDATSIAEVLDTVSQKIKAKRPGDWIIGSGKFMTYSGWDDKKLKERRWLTRSDLDPVSPQNPVVLIKDGGHALVANSVALRAAGIDKNAPDPRKELVKDPVSGELTGAILESSMDLIYKHFPALSMEDRVGAAASASRQLLEMGTTTVADAAVNEKAFPVFQELVATRHEPLVSYVLMPEVPTAGSLQESQQFVRSWRLKTGFGDQRLKLGALKFFVDGGITAGSAWFTVPYKNRPGHYGIQRIDTKMLYELVRLGDELGWQLHFHTCGDAAAELVLDALEAAKKQNKTSGRRHVLTHLYYARPAMIRRMKELDVIVVLQPNFVYTLGEHMRAAMQDEQLEHYMPFKSLLAAGVPVALSADGHPQNPVYGIMGAVVRRTDQGNPLGESEAVTLMDALRAYTRTSAYSLYEEERRGSIEPGKLADLIVLDRDILAVPPKDIKDLKILLTLKEGRIAVDHLARENPH